MSDLARLWAQLIVQIASAENKAVTDQMSEGVFRDAVANNLLPWTQTMLDAYATLSEADADRLAEMEQRLGSDAATVLSMTLPNWGSFLCYRAQALDLPVTPGGGGYPDVKTLVDSLDLAVAWCRTQRPSVAPETPIEPESDYNAAEAYAGLMRMLEAEVRAGRRPVALSRQELDILGAPNPFTANDLLDLTDAIPRAPPGSFLIRGADGRDVTDEELAGIAAALNPTPN
jgi:hypothetical protein